MMPATNAIHAMLITPSANSDAISAQQQPTHQAPFLAPIRTAPDGPSRHDVSSRPSGLRHLPTHTSLSGVSWYTAATRSVMPATARPALLHERPSPAIAKATLPTANASTPATAHVSR